jgi:hypothetical protein
MNVSTSKTIDPPSWLIIFTTSLVGFWLLGNLLRVTLPFGGSIYPHDILLLLLCLFNWRQVVELTSQTMKGLVKNPLLMLSFAWLALGWCVAWASGASALLGIAYAVRLVLYIYSLIILMQYWKDNPLPIHAKTQDIFISLPTFTTAITFFFSVLGILQYVFIPDTRFLASLGWDDHYYRLLSTQLDPNFAGIIIVMGILAATALKKSVWRLTSLTLLGISLLLTWSRASWAALCVGLVWLAWKKSPKKVIAVLLGLFIFSLIVVIIPKPTGEGGNIFRTSTITSRYQNILAWTASLKPYEWIIGKGLFVPTYTPTSAVTNNARLPDAWPLTVFVGTGLVGVVLLALVVLRSRKVWDSFSFYQEAILVGVLCHGLLNNTLTQPFVFLALLTILFAKKETV